MMMMIVRMMIAMMYFFLSLSLLYPHMPAFLVIAHVPDSLEDTEDDHIQSGRLCYGCGRLCDDSNITTFT